MRLGRREPALGFLDVSRCQLAFGAVEVEGEGELVLRRPGVGLEQRKPGGAAIGARAESRGGARAPRGHEIEARQLFTLGRLVHHRGPAVQLAYQVEDPVGQSVGRRARQKDSTDSKDG